MEIDGCALTPCFPGVTCTDAPAPATGRTCGACPTGTFGDGAVCTSCTAVTACAGALTCTTGADSVCAACATGTAQATPGAPCTDIDACAVAACDPNATCTDLAPPALGNAAGRTCACDPGFWGSGTTCTACTSAWPLATTMAWLPDALERVHDYPTSTVGDVSATPGPLGTARYFDGDGDYVEVDDDEALWPAASFSLEAWVRPEPQSGTATIAAKYDCGDFCASGLSTARIVLSVDPDGQPTLGLRDSADNTQNIIAAIDITDGLFHHVVGVRDVTQATLDLYVDGVLLATAPLTATATFVSGDGQLDPLILGAQSVAGGPGRFNFLRGAIDEVAMHHVALDAASVAARFHAADGTCQCPAGQGPDGSGACVDLDECAVGSGGCGAGATCTNTTGGRTCACGAGGTDTGGGTGTSCAYPTDCLALHLAAPALIDGVYVIDADGPGGKSAFAAFCDMSTDGGGWTLAYTTSDDGQATFTWNSRSRLTTDAVPIGSPYLAHRDLKSPALHRLPLTALLFDHPSGDYAVYGVYTTAPSFAAHIAAISDPQCPAARSTGLKMLAGTLTATALPPTSAPTGLCDTDLYFHLGDRESGSRTVSACLARSGSSFQDAFGPTWNIRYNSTHADCAFDDSALAATGPKLDEPNAEFPAQGFGLALGLNTGTAGTAANYLQVFVRNHPLESCFEWKQAGATASGTYTIDPDGPSGPTAPSTVSCDMAVVGSAPTAPASVSVTPASGALAVSWSTVTADPPVTAYTATATPGGASCSATPPALTCTITGLSTGTTYSVTVAATSSVGTSTASTPVQGTPAGGTITFSTLNYNGMTGYPLDFSDGCHCCSPTTTQQQMDALCQLAGRTQATGWVAQSLSINTCYCWGACSNFQWQSNCCSGQQTQRMVTSVTCQ